MQQRQRLQQLVQQLVQQLIAVGCYKAAAGSAADGPVAAQALPRV